TKQVSVRKQREKSTLSSYIEAFGVEMHACAFCRRNGRRYVTATGSTRCSECVNAHQSCDRSSAESATLLRIVREKKRLRKQRLETREGLSALRRSLEASQAVVQQTQSQIMAAFAKLDRLEKMEDRLEERGAKAAGVLDALEREESGVETEVLFQQPVGGPSQFTADLDWGSTELGDFLLSSSGVVGENFSVNIGH
ncbi:hypothetical protein NW767_014566, partial [Fusarium falciforme]